MLCVKVACTVFFLQKVVQKDFPCFKVVEILEMCSVSLFESEELVKNLKPLDLTKAGHRSWIDQVTLFNQYAYNEQSEKSKMF